jgi:hypothetical protein
MLDVSVRLAWSVLEERGPRVFEKFEGRIDVERRIYKRF